MYGQKAYTDNGSAENAERENDTVTEQVLHICF